MRTKKQKAKKKGGVKFTNTKLPLSSITEVDEDNLTSPERSPRYKQTARYRLAADAQGQQPPRETTPSDTATVDCNCTPALNGLCNIL